MVFFGRTMRENKLGGITFVEWDWCLASTDPSLMCEGTRCERVVLLSFIIEMFNVEEKG